MSSYLYSYNKYANLSDLANLPITHAPQEDHQGIMVSACEYTVHPLGSLTVSALRQSRIPFLCSGDISDIAVVYAAGNDNTTEAILKVAGSLGVHLDAGCIDRSNRMGRTSPESSGTRNLPTPRDHQVHVL